MKTQLELMFCSEFGFFPPQSLLDVIPRFRKIVGNATMGDNELLRAYHLTKMRTSDAYYVLAVSKILLQEKAQVAGK